MYYLGDLDPKNTLDLKHKSWLKTTFNISNKDIKTRYVKTLRLEKILDKHNFKEIDFMNIDIEGHEIEVLKSINFRKTNVNVICVEVLDYDKRKKKQLLNFFKKNNYFLKKRVSINYIFQKKS